MAEQQLNVKLIMTWDILPEHEQEYFEFVIREFIPGARGWVVNFPMPGQPCTATSRRFLVGAVLPSLNRARQLLASPEWDALHTKLLDFVQNYSQKIVAARSSFQF